MTGTREKRKTLPLLIRHLPKAQAVMYDKVQRMNDAWITKPKVPVICGRFHVTGIIGSDAGMGTVGETETFQFVCNIVVDVFA